jgi:hypothetical protein
METTHTTNPRRAEMRERIKDAREAGALDKTSGGVNRWLIHQYMMETGQTDFRTFKSWKEGGYSVKKGEKGFPIFSRPLGAIALEKGKEIDSDTAKQFKTCYLFHAGQVEIKEGKQ